MESFEVNNSTGEYSWRWKEAHYRAQPLDPVRGQKLLLRLVSMLEGVELIGLDGASLGVDGEVTGEALKGLLPQLLKAISLVASKLLVAGNEDVIKQLLFGVSRNGEQLVKSGEYSLAYSKAYMANYGELMHALSKVIEYNFSSAFEMLTNPT